MRNFISSLPLKAPHPHLPVQTGINSCAPRYAPFIPAKALLIYLLTPFLEYWKFSVGYLLKSRASMATITESSTIDELCKGHYPSNLKLSEYPLYFANLLAE
jgi:hypothetical protein